jgi:hypothetical protein
VGQFREKLSDLGISSHEGIQLLRFLCGEQIVTPPEDQLPGAK